MSEHQASSQVFVPRRSAGTWYNPVALLRGLSVRPKLYLAVTAALATIYFLPVGWSWSARAVGGWNAGAVVYLVLAVHLMSTCDIGDIRERSAREDETRFAFFTMILLAVATSFAAVIELIGEAKAAGEAGRLLLALAAIAILASWLVMQVVFTLHYAHDYYRPAEDGSGDVGGLQFPGEGAPDYWDFFYFTTSIGATSQTSDVSVTGRAVRRLVAFQAILAFVFNTTVVALAINLAAGLI